MSDFNLARVLQEFEKLADMPVAERVECINILRRRIHKFSPFQQEPVDCVMWVPKEAVRANDYNPNSVAPPEMQLLACSIEEDGYTQPIVAWEVEEGYEIVDGFHRHRVGKECADITARVHGYLPITLINANKTDKADRIASTIRHNRARGKHSVDAMSEIVIELKKRNWTKERIAKHLGMDADEILNHTWETFCHLLLQSLPEQTARHYLRKFKVFLGWWRSRGYPEGIPQEAPGVLEAKKLAPSWRRLCKTLLRNDYWCKGLGFTQPRSEAYGKYLQIKKRNKKLAAMGAA